jgi:hypothetical protein
MLYGRRHMASPLLAAPKPGSTEATLSVLRRAIRDDDQPKATECALRLLESKPAQLLLDAAWVDYDSKITSVIVRRPSIKESALEDTVRAFNLVHPHLLAIDQADLRNHAKAAWSGCSSFSLTEPVFLTRDEFIADMRLLANAQAQNYFALQISDQQNNFVTALIDTAPGEWLDVPTCDALAREIMNLQQLQEPLRERLMKALPGWL